MGGGVNRGSDESRRRNGMQRRNEFAVLKGLGFNHAGHGVFFFGFRAFSEYT